MRDAGTRSKPRRRSVGSTLIGLALLAATIYLFWIYPGQRPPPPIDIRFEPLNEQPNLTSRPPETPSAANETP